ncbi:MAG: hypothetical protein RR338_04785, partial [Clostridia bacterium]
KYVKLLADVTVNTLARMAGDYNQDSGDFNNFRGTFDGDGHTIQINLNSTGRGKRYSLFPNAGGNPGTTAVIKNLSIHGAIVGGDCDIAGFVSKPRGALRFENCTNGVAIDIKWQADVSFGWNAGGFVGFTNNYDIEFVDCVNKADIRANNNNDTGQAGSGGLVGGVAAGSAVTIESCRNSGFILGDENPGGLVGRNCGNVTIKNSANSGEIYANLGGDHNEGPLNIESSAGGLVGRADGSVKLYASYNNGTVVGDGNRVGGLIGNDPIVSGKQRTIVYYCYNTGDVYSGSIYPHVGDAGDQSGCKAGGVTGYASNIDIRYFYNTGKITANGLDGRTLVWHAQVAGMVGFVPGDATSVTVANSYNVGQIIIGASGVSIGSIGDAHYAAGLVGYIENDARGKTTDTDCYSLENQCYRYAKNNWMTNEDHGGYNKNSRTGNVRTMDQMITGYTSNGTDDFMRPTSMDRLNSSNFSNSTVLSTENIISGSYSGFIFPYGCLPQLSVFAVDTQNGLSMLSKAYRKNQYGEFVLQTAGDEFDPYVIKDGIEIAALSAAVNSTGGSNYWHADNKFFTFANGVNNLPTPPSPTPTTCKEIDMNTFK